MLYFEMPFLTGLIMMRLFPLVRWHYCQVWFWCLYALFWDVILVMFDINVCLPSFEMSFLSGLILMCLCPLLRCHSCQVWYWCLYALFWDAILIRFDNDVFMPSFEMPFLSGFILMSLYPVFRCHSCQYELLFSPTCSFIRMRQTSYRGLSRKTKGS
jgi:hypothetical protein